MIILSTIRETSFLNVFVQRSGISNSCVVGIVGVARRRAMLTTLSGKQKKIQSILIALPRNTRSLISRLLGRIDIVASDRITFSHSLSYMRGIGVVSWIDRAFNLARNSRTAFSSSAG